MTTTRPAPRRPQQALEDRILDRVSREVGVERSGAYFGRQAQLRYERGRLDVTVPTGFVAELIGRRFGDSLKKAARDELGDEAPRTVELRFRVDSAAFGPRPAMRPARHETEPQRHSLDDYIIGDSNRLAASAAARLAGDEGAEGCSPLFIHGSCGLGKTHLLQGIAARFREQHPGAGVRCVTGEAFTNEYIAAVRAGRLESFRAAFRSVALLCIDDVHFLANKQATQSELLHTFDAVDLAGARVALASDEHPRTIGRLSAALVSRFVSGMVVRIDPPEPDLRRRIILHVAQRRGLTLDPAAVAFLASMPGPRNGPSPSVRDLIGALTRIEAIRRLVSGTGGEGPIGLLAVRRALGVGEPTPDGSPGRPRRPVRVERIAETVCRTLGVEHAELVGRGRHRRVVLARSITAHLSRELTTLSYPEIARAMGRPNHSTVVTACKRLRSQIDRAEPADAGPEHAGLTVGALCEQLRDDILRSSSP